MYKKFQAFLKRNKIELTHHQAVMAMAVMSVMDIHPSFLACLTGKTTLFKWIDRFFDTLPKH